MDIGSKISREESQYKIDDFINYSNKNGFDIQEYDGFYYMVQIGKRIIDGNIVDDSDYLQEQKMRDIDDLKQQLSDTDYKIIKCYECSLIGEELPYNVVELHKERQKIRNMINSIENE